MPQFQLKVIRDSNPDCRINPDLDPDVYQICFKTLWMHYVVGVSHFAKYATYRPLIVWEMLTNVRSDEENEKVTGNPHTDPDHHQKLISSRWSSLAHVPRRSSLAHVPMPAKFGWHPFRARQLSCPLTKLNGGLSRLHSADEDAVSWLTNYS